MEKEQTTRKISVVVPIVRQDKARRCIEAIKKNAGLPLDQFEIVQAVDVDGVGCPVMVKNLVEKTRYDLVMFLGDDTIPEPGFMAAALAVMDSLPDGWGVVGLNTEDPKGTNFKAHWLAHKAMLSLIPGGAFFAVDYRHCFCDDELYDIAVENNRWVMAEDARILHDHPINKKGDADDLHLVKAYGNGAFEHDQKTYWRRKHERMRELFGTRLGVAWPLTDDMVPAQFVYSFMGLEKPNMDFFVPDFPGRIDAVRNDLVVKALNEGVTHLFMTDTDQIYFDSKTITKMLAHYAPVVSAPVFRRYVPFDPILFRNVTDKQVVPVGFEELAVAVEKGACLEVDVTGMGCVLFDMRVFMNIDPPWFKLPAFGERGPGEDIYFWHKANAAGYSVLTDCSIKVEHITKMGVGFETCKVFNQLMEGRKNGK